MSEKIKKWSVLIFEDDLDLARQWTKYFEEKNMIVNHALSVDEAIAYCNQTEYDAIILDIFLKDSEGKLIPRAGFTLLSYIRNSSLEKVPQWGVTVPIIVVTGTANNLGFDPLKNAKSVYSSEATDVLRKPFKPEVLYSKLTQMIKNHTED